MQPFGGALNATAIFKARIARSRFMRLLRAHLLPDSGLPLQTMRGRAHALNAGPSLMRLNIGDVTGPLLIWLVCHEVTVQQVRRDIELVIAVCRYLMFTPLSWFANKPLPGSE
jgi:hypothetical protein